MLNMGHKERRTFIVVLIVMIFMCLFPPQIEKISQVRKDYGEVTLYENIEYNFFATGPTETDPQATIHTSSRVDYGRLLLQWMIAIMMGLVVIFVLKDIDQSS